MNLILFEENEAGVPLRKRDGRAVHLVKILRKKEGDEFDAGLIGGKRGKGRIERFGDDGALFFSLDLTEFPPPRLPVTVAAGFPRPVQTRRLLRDLTSMGVREISLMGCELGDRNYLKTTLLTDGGARAALIEGAVQARDTVLPRLAVYPSLPAWLKCGLPACGGEAALIACDNVSPSGSLGCGLYSAGRPAVIAVGPERGWSDSERRQLEEAGFRRLSLGSRALRTETACVAAVAIITAGWPPPPA
jgi:RsmE family RNA methyltransferase